MSKVFISYRRNDLAAYAPAIYRELVQYFSKDQVFMEVDTMKPGVDFVRLIKEAVSECDVLVALIGKRWANTSKGAQSPLDNPNDFVRLEISTALARNLEVIPVLVDGATMPPGNLLPSDLRELTLLKPMEISDTYFNYDVGQLVAAVRNIFEVSEPKRKADEENRRRIEEETNRTQQEANQRRLAAEVQRKAEEEHLLEQKRQRSEKEAKRKAEEENRRRIEEEKKLSQEAEQRRREAEEQRKAEAELRREQERQRSEEETRRKAGEEKERNHAKRGSGIDIYDVFISFKNTDENGVRTRDAELANEVYDFLKSKGLKVFISTVTLASLGVSNYTKAIDEALDATSIVVAVGTSAENLDSEWVRYEWGSFYNDILSRKKPDGKVFTYVSGLRPAQLPRALRQTQTFIHSSEALKTLHGFIVQALR